MGSQTNFEKVRNRCEALLRPLPSYSGIWLIPQIVILAALALAQLPTPAQETKRPPSREVLSGQSEEVSPGDTIRVETDLIPIEVTVRNAAGQPVRGLQPNDFKIFEDGTERPISFFSTQTATGSTRCPLDLVFALDVSGSMGREEIEMLHRAVTLFAGRLSGPRSRFAVVTFGMKVKVLQTLTDDPRKLDKAFGSAKPDKDGLSTHAYDAVDDAVRMLVRQGRKTAPDTLTKRAIVVISDGFPVGDTVSSNTVIERANNANVTVYTVTMPSFSFTYTAVYGRPLPTILDVSGLAEGTGGMNSYATDGNYSDALTAIAREVVSHYVLAFYPGRENRRDGNFHKVRVEARDGMKVSQSRQGYPGSTSR